MATILVASFIPTHPPTAGNRVRILKQVELLRRLGHDVHFLYFDDGTPGCIEPMRSWWGDRLDVTSYTNPAKPPLRFRQRAVLGLCRRLGLPPPRSLRRKQHFGIDEWFDPALGPALRGACERTGATAVIVEYVFFSKALESVPEGTLKIIDTHDVFAERMGKSSSTWFATSRGEEARGLDRADIVFAIQKEEARYFESLSRSRVVTIGHPVDIVDLPAPPDTGMIEAGYLASHNGDNVAAAEWFLREVYPRVRDANPAIRFTIAGTVCDKLHALPPDVRQVPRADTMADVYANLHIVINPARSGTGLKIKTVEALGYGKPLVVTPVGAEGLLPDVEAAVALADDPAAFADALLDLAAHPERRERLGRAALDFCRQYNGQLANTLRDVFGPAHGSFPEAS